MSNVSQIPSPSAPDLYPSLEPRLAAAICRALAESFEALSGIPSDQDIAHLAAFNVIEVLNMAGLGRPELETAPQEDLSRLTRPGVLPAVKPIWDCSVQIATWACTHGPQKPS